MQSRRQSGRYGSSPSTTAARPAGSCAWVSTPVPGCWRRWSSSSRAAKRWSSTRCRPARSTWTSYPSDRHLPSDSLVNSDRDFRPSRDSSDHRRNADERAWLYSARSTVRCEERVAVAVAAPLAFQARAYVGLRKRVPGAATWQSRTRAVVFLQCSHRPRAGPLTRRESTIKVTLGGPKHPRLAWPRGVGGLCQDDGMTIQTEAEPLDIQGFWWLPEHEDHQVFGTLRWTIEAGGQLRLQQRLQPVVWRDNVLPDGNIQRYPEGRIGSRAGVPRHSRASR